MISLIYAICFGFFFGYNIQLNLSNFSAMALGQSPDPNLRVGLVSSVFCMGYFLLGGHVAFWALSALVPIALIAADSYMLYGKMPDISLSISQFISSLNIPYISPIACFAWGYFMQQDKKLQSWQKQECNYPKIRDALNYTLTNLHLLAYAGILVSTIAFCSQYAFLDLGARVITALISIVIFEISMHPGLLSQYTKGGLQYLSILSNCILNPSSALIHFSLHDSLPYLQALASKTASTLLCTVWPFLRKAKAAGERSLKTDYKPESCETFTDDLKAILTIQQDLTADFKAEEIQQAQEKSKKTLRSLIDNYVKSKPAFQSLYQYYPVILILIALYFPLSSLVFILSFFVVEAAFNYYQKNPSLKEVESRISDDPEYILKGSSQHTYEQHQEWMRLSNDWEVKAKLRFAFNPEKLKQVPKIELKFPEINDQMSDEKQKQAIDQYILPYLDKNNELYLGKKAGIEEELKGKIDDLKDRIKSTLSPPRGIERPSLTIRSIAHILRTFHETDDIGSLNESIKTFPGLFKVCSAGIEYNVFNLSQKLTTSGTALGRVDTLWDMYVQSFWTRQVQPIEDTPGFKSIPFIYWWSCNKVNTSNSDQQDLHASNAFNLMWTKNLPSCLYITSRNETIGAANQNIFNLFNLVSVPSIEHLFNNEWQLPLSDSSTGAIIKDYLMERLLKKTDGLSLSDFKTMYAILPHYMISDSDTLRLFAKQAIIELRKASKEVNAVSVMQYLHESFPSTLLFEDTEILKEELKEAVIEQSITDLEASKQLVDEKSVYQHYQTKFSDFFADERFQLNISEEDIKPSIGSEYNLQKPLRRIMEKMIESFDTLGKPHTAAMAHIMMQTGYVVRSKDIAKEQEFSGLSHILSIIKSVPMIILDLPKIIQSAFKFTFKLSIDIICLPVSSAKLAYRHVKPRFASDSKAKEVKLQNMPVAPAA